MKCPNCGSEIPDHVNYCEFCGHSIRYSPHKSFKVKNKRIGKFIPILLCVEIVIIVILASILLRQNHREITRKTKKGINGKVSKEVNGKQRERKKEEAGKQYLTYFKDNKILIKEVGNWQGDPFFLTTYDYTYMDYRDSWESYIQFSSDNSYVYYPENITTPDEMVKSTFTLMRTRPFSENREILAENVVKYLLLEHGDIIFINNNSELYYLNKNDKIKLASDVNEYKVNEKYWNVLWTVSKEDDEKTDVGEDDGPVIKYDVYSRDFNSKSVENRLLSDVDEVYFFDKAVLAKKNKILYCITNGKKTEKISEDVTGYPEVSKEGTIFYTKKSDEDAYTSWVNDPYKESDQNNPDYYGNEANWDEWHERVAARNKAREITEENMTSLFSYHNGKETWIVDYFCSLDNSSSHKFGRLFMFYIYDIDNVKKINIEDLMYADISVEQFFDQAMQETKKACIFSDGDIIPLEKPLRNAEFDSSGEIGFGIYDEKEDGGGIIYSFDSTKTSDGKLKKIADNALNLMCVDGKEVYYETYNVDENNGENALYCNGRELSQYSSIISGKVDGYVLYTADDTIWGYDGKDTIQLADNAYVENPHFQSGGEDGVEYLLIIENIDSNNRKGVLSVYNGLQPIGIVDTHVEKVLGYYDPYEE